jgi:hypothetical protein
MKIAKVRNPASLLLVNPQRSKTTMQVVKRKTNITRRKPATATNRRKKNTSVKVYASRQATNRRRNPFVRRRKRNPQIKTLIMGSLYAAAGAMTQGLVASFIPLKAEGVIGIGINLGIAYVTALLGERVLGAGLNSQFFAVGAAAGVGKSILDYVLGFAKGAVGQLAPAGAPQVGTSTEQSMNDIVPWEGGWPYGGGMGDIVAWDNYGQPMPQQAQPRIAA